MLHSLYDREATLRNKRWVRYTLLEKLNFTKLRNHSNSIRDIDYHKSYLKLTSAAMQEGIKMKNILLGSITVEEELYTLTRGSCCIAKSLSYRFVSNGDQGRDINCLRITYTPAENEAVEEDVLYQERVLHIDDISEIRPGKMSFAADGNEYPLSLTVVGMSGLIALVLHVLIGCVLCRIGDDYHPAGGDYSPAGQADPPLPGLRVPPEEADIRGLDCLHVPRLPQLWVRGAHGTD